MVAPYNLILPGQIAVDVISRLQCDQQDYHKYPISIQWSSLPTESRGDVVKIQNWSPWRSRLKAVQKSRTNYSLFIAPKQGLCLYGIDMCIEELEKWENIIFWKDHVSFIMLLDLWSTLWTVTWDVLRSSQAAIEDCGQNLTLYLRDVVTINVLLQRVYDLFCSLHNIHQIP